MKRVPVCLERLDMAGSALANDVELPFFGLNALDIMRGMTVRAYGRLRVSRF